MSPLTCKVDHNRPRHPHWLLSPYLEKLYRRTSKALRAKVAARAKTTTKPLVKKTVSKTTGKTVVCSTQMCFQFLKTFSSCMYRQRLLTWSLNFLNLLFNNYVGWWWHKMHITGQWIAIEVRGKRSTCFSRVPTALWKGCGILPQEICAGPRDIQGIEC